MIRHILFAALTLGPVFSAEAQTDQQQRCPALAGNELEQVQGWNETIRAYYRTSSQKQVSRPEYLQALFDYQAYLQDKVAAIPAFDDNGMEGSLNEASCLAQQNQLQKITDLLAAEKRLTPNDPAFKGKKINSNISPVIPATTPEGVNVPCADPLGAELEQVRSWNAAISTYRTSIGDKTPVMRASYVNALLDYSAYLFGQLSAVGATRDPDRAGGELVTQSCAAQEASLKEIQDLIAAEKGKAVAAAKQEAKNPFDLGIPQHRQ